MMLKPFVYQIRKKIEQNGLVEASFLLMVSGGKDSMSLLEAFRQLQGWKNISYRVLYVHHGSGENGEYRDQALRVVKNYCEQYQISFVCNDKEEIQLKSEEEFRMYRQKVGAKWKTAEEILVTGHHKEDLLETRILRLIRGTGAEGLLAMTVFDDSIFRPLLEVSPNEVAAFVNENYVPYLQDPSNHDERFLRNWLRNTWLPNLEAIRPGALLSLSKSLENIANQWVEPRERLSQWYEKGVIDRKAFLCLDHSQQLQVLALCLQDNGIYEFRRSQLEEALKLLDRGQNRYTFDLLQLNWQVNEDSVEIKKHA